LSAVGLDGLRPEYFGQSCWYFDCRRQRHREVERDRLVTSRAGP
jgi:hypothetical protein